MSTTGELIERLRNQSWTWRDLEAAAARLDELERENAELREALKPFAAQTRASSLTEEKMILAARAALAGSGK